MTKTILGLGCAAAMMIATNAQGAVVFQDDFESYADTAAMQAVWGAAGLGTLDAALGNPGQSMAHPGGTDNIVTIPVTQASASNPLVYTAQIYDDGSSANKRITAGLRFSGVANLIEMGMYNNPSHYAVRAVLPGPSWVAFSNMVDDLGQPIQNAPVVGWHTFQMVHDGTNATFTIDLNSDGNINGTAVLAASWNAAGVDQIRLGGPSNLSSAGGGANFDNIKLEVVPEPASLGLMGLGGLALLSRKRR